MYNLKIDEIYSIKQDKIWVIAGITENFIKVIPVVLGTGQKHPPHPDKSHQDKSPLTKSPT